jgi:hypothetical protein
MKKARVTATCAANGCSWCIHISPTPYGKIYKIKTYNENNYSMGASELATQLLMQSQGDIYIDLKYFSKNKMLLVKSNR